MKRKNKVVLALSICAVALVVASGVVRCSLAEPEDTEASGQDAQQPQQFQEAEDAGDGQSRQDGAQGGFADLKNTSWESEDGKSALSIIEGALIESDEAGQTILYYTLDEEAIQGSEITATLSVASSMTGDESKTVAVVRTAGDGRREIACDRLKCRYEMKAPEATAIEVIGAGDELYDAFGKTPQDFEDALLQYARENAPSATSATWGKEVWIDFASGTYLTNFTLNDAASTIVTLQMDDAGRLGAL